MKKSKLPWTDASSMPTDYSVQKMAPYIGRLKTTIARHLIEKYSNPLETVVDPFCGSGVVPLEAKALNRNAIGFDWNPYGVILSKGKVGTPLKQSTALKRFKKVWLRSRELLCEQDLRTVPIWVRKFFHRETLREALAFRDACVEAGDDFLLACLLGILHHQRPGFLSFPASHLVPYLRTRNFPRSKYPHLYRKRALLPRMVAKIVRTYKNPLPKNNAVARIAKGDSRKLAIKEKIGAVITSPPYMNELDYVRDNRLRLWFIEKHIDYSKELSSKTREDAFQQLMSAVINRLAPKITIDGFFVFVVGDVTRRRKSKRAPDQIIQEIFQNDQQLKSFKLKTVLKDKIPDLRRARRGLEGTKNETILIYKKNIEKNWRGRDGKATKH
jgi:DNA modification methylase